MSIANVEFGSVGVFRIASFILMPRIRPIDTYAGRIPVFDTVRHFIDCVARRQEPSITLPASRHVAAVVDAIARSRTSGGPEELR